MYLGLVIGGVIAIVWTIFALRSFNKPAGILILLSEIFLLLRHTVQLINVGDQFGADKMSQFLTDLFTHVAFWSYIVGTFIEFALLFEPLYSSNQVASSPSADVNFQGNSNNDLDNRVSSYKTMKSRSDAAPVNPGVPTNAV